MAREVTKSLLSVWTDEGKGAKVRRSIGRPEVDIVSLMHDANETICFKNY